ncbi:MAG: tetrahydrofolate synthase [Bacteroidia bacterium]|nr:MAG: tetrahydrofolate synthase [Bacteroidia bacterium]
MNYQQTLDFMFTQLPMFQRQGKAAYKANLNNTLALDAHFQYPHCNFKTIHVAGTNGKGSVSHALAAILQSTGLKVGLYTSPHLRDFRERIKINGTPISEEKVVDFVADNSEILKDLKPSFFEMTVAMAFNYFSEQKVDIAVIEVGLGGRLDSTNIITPLLSIITNISKDHTNLLGDDIMAIAKEKAGIIKQNVPVVIGETQAEITSVFSGMAKEKNAPITYADGKYQQKNIRTVLAAFEILRDLGFSITENQIADGLQNIVAKTGLLGRWQILQQQPLVICDTGHNVAGIKEIVAQLKGLKYNKMRVVMGMVDDKNIDGVLALMPEFATYYFAQANIPRALAKEKLQEQAKMYGLFGKVYNSVAEALQNAINEASKEDVIFVGGSTFVVAEVV